MAAMALVTEVHVRDFRTLDELALELGPVCALVGEARAGKSNLLAALRAVLDPEGAGVDVADVRRGRRELRVRARLASGTWLELAGRPPAVEHAAGDGRPPVLFLPARERMGTAEAQRALRDLEARLRDGMRGVVVLVEEPEL